MAQIAFGDVPVIPVDSQGLTRCRVKFDPADMSKTRPFQTQRLPACASANFY
jgi:hypothetical protein